MAILPHHGEHDAHSPALHDTLVALEWQQVLQAVAELCASPIGRQRLTATLPCPTLEAARAKMQLTERAIALRTQGTPLPSNDLHDLSSTLTDLDQGRALGAAQLWSITACLGHAARLRSFVCKQAADFALLQRNLEVSPKLTPVLERLARSVTPSGEITDAASPDLEQARRRVEGARQKLRRVLDGCLQRYAALLQGSYLAERDGRYVLPVRSDAEDRCDGLVLGASASGQTLYLAPRESLEPGNSLAKAEASVLREQDRVLQELSALLRPLGLELHQAYEACVLASQLRALAEYAQVYQASALLIDEIPRINLRGVRHPLLLIKSMQPGVEKPEAPLAGQPSSGVAPPLTVVPNDIALASGHALVISGPNAGGKTVALKCLGLALLMARSGIPVPAAAESEIGFFDRVFVEIGDHQSLTQSLSRFTAHIDSIRQCLLTADRSTLVLIDELAAGTDPLEGAALAQALLESFCERGAASAVTTHYEQLKSLASNADGPFLNAGAEFDLETLTPTFRLHQGTAGISSALAVAARRGIPASVVTRAEELMPEAARLQRDALHAIERDRLQMQRARERAVAHEREQELILAELERRRQRFEASERERLQRETRELVSEVKAARDKLREARQQLSQPLNREAYASAEKAVSLAAQSVAIGGRLSQLVRPAVEMDAASPQLAMGDQDVVAGQRAHYPKLAIDVEVVTGPHKGRVQVKAGAMRMQVALQDLIFRQARQAVSTPRTLKARSQKANPAPITGAATPSSSLLRTQDTTCDLRGLRAEDALARVDALIDHLLTSGDAGGFALHGHGTGALKRAVRAHLRTHPQIASCGPAERDDGGDALTAFWLKD